MKVVLGQPCNQLTPLRVVGRRPHNREAIYECECQCGNRLQVRSYYLSSGHTKSCGCLRAEVMRATATKHGMSSSPEYRVWHDMNRRCHDPRLKCYPRYGGRGITVCDRWRGSFEAFYQDMGPRPSPHHTVERKDNDGPYSPDNCVWAPREAQAKNKRTTRLLTARGKTQHLAEWARELGVGHTTITARLKAGWDVERALFTPVHPPAPRPTEEP